MGKLDRLHGKTLKVTTRAPQGSLLLGGGVALGVPLSPQALPTKKKNSENYFFQDKFDHDKGQKSAISGRRLQWRLSTGFFAFSPVFMCNLVRRAPKILRK